MDDVKIALQFNPEHFKEIYYTNGQGSMLTYKPTQKAIAYFVTLTILTAIIYFVAASRPDLSWLIVPGCIGMLFTGIYALVMVSRYQKWKKGIRVYLKDLSKYGSCTMQLTAYTIEVRYDTATFIEKWNNVSSAQIFDTHIMLDKIAGATYMFPAKAMQLREFNKLKEFIINKLKTPVEDQPVVSQSL